MQVLPDSVIINVSPSQRKLLREPEYAPNVAGLISDLEKGGRGRISIADIETLLASLRKLRGTVSNTSNRQPAEVVDQLILKVEEAASAHIRAYGAPNSN